MKKVNYKFLRDILLEIMNNSQVSEKKLAEKFGYSERTVRRYIKILKDENIIRLEKTGKIKNWKIL